MVMESVKTSIFAAEKKILNFGFNKKRNIMRQNFCKIALACLLTFSAASSNAQSLLDGLKNAAVNAAASAANDATGNSTIGNIITNLLGTGAVSQSSITGTWSYTEPCFVAESDNVLSSVASNALIGKAQTYLSSGLSKAGMTAGKVILTFDGNGGMTCVVNGKKVSGTYTIDGCNLNVTILKRTFKINCKLSGGDLQLSLDISKLLSFVNTVSSSAAQASGSLSSLTSLLSNVKGLYAGLQFHKR